jgi:hypothetical protein
LLDSDLVIPYLADDPATVPLVERLALEGIAISIITSRIWRSTKARCAAPTPNSPRSNSSTSWRWCPPSPSRQRSHVAAPGCAKRSWGAVAARGNRALDLVIAATALENDLRLVTRNLADYTDIPELALYEPS